MAKAEKSENINIRVTAQLKALAEAAAEEDGRSLTSYIGALIRADAAKRGIKGKRTVRLSS